jgi:hypothetical protein
LPENAVAKLDLLDLSDEDRSTIESKNAAAIMTSSAPEPKSRRAKVTT